MPVLHSPESEFAKERVKWEAYPTSMGPGLRPYIKREYPQVLYLAGRVDGSLVITETVTVESLTAASCHLNAGFLPDPLSAIEAVHGRELEIAKLAANRAYHEQRMSPKAQAEAAQAESEASGHLVSVPVTPIKRAYRRKPVAVKE